MDRPLAGLYVLAGKRKEKKKSNEEVEQFFTLKIFLGNIRYESVRKEEA